ncbi:coiled-coil domain-containing protein [Endozoicomonas euniceicola]|uniref:OTU domain-containing protein n=1 Tax=Endozoicomonas euniceicola TaxID=1234143 RepID=A0ABY6H0G6_9GAMM|nr:hypothetical protein [Endozoicomonas euniceicola]UYM18317.1 hypothetical protein NX720_10545 [Endozoicomonas euniceicola]
MSSSAPNKININRCLTHNMSVGHRGISQDDEFSLLNQFVPDSLAAVIFEGSDHVRQFYLVSRQNDWFMPESTEEINTNLKLEIPPEGSSPLHNNLYIFPSLSESFLSTPHNKAPDILVVEFLLPENGQTGAFPPEGNQAMSVEVLEDRWRYKINLGLLNNPMVISLPGCFALSPADSGVCLNACENLTPLPIAILQESGKTITEDTKAVSGDVALIVYYPPAKFSENQAPLYETHIWVVPRSEHTQSPPEPYPSQLEFQPEDPLHTDKGRADKTKRKSQKAHSTDTESIESLIQQVEGVGISVACKESAFYKVDDLMEVVLKLFARRSDLQASNPRSQPEKKFRYYQLKKADLALSRGFHIVIDYFFKCAELETPVTTFRELSGEGVKYIPLSFIAKTYPQIQNLQYNSDREHQKLVLHTQNSIEMVLMALTYISRQNGRRSIIDPLTDIWGDIRTVVISFASSPENFTDASIGTDIIYRLMLFAIEVTDVDMIFSLCDRSSHVYHGGIKTSRYERDNSLTTLRKTYMSAWTKLKALLSTQDIPVPQLRQLIEGAGRIGINTALWSTEVDHYEQMKEDAIAAKRESNAAEWEKKVSLAEQHGRELLLQIDREQAELALLREQRDKKQKTVRQKENRLVPLQQESPATTEPEEQARDKPPEVEPEWRRLYWAGAEAYKESGAELALELFQKALDAQPDQLSRARILSAMADCYFVPGEKKLKSLFESYNKALAFRRQMEHEAQQQQRPTLDKNALNALSYQFLKAIETLLEPIKQSTRLHSDALESLSLVDILSPGVDKEEAECLLLILIKEWEQLSSMSSRLRDGNDALIATYHLRQQIIKNLITTGATRISEETITRKKLETARKKMSSSGQKKGKGVKRGKGIKDEQREDISIQDNLNTHYERLSKELGHFEQVASMAKALLDSWKSPQPRFGEQPAIKLSEKDWQAIRELLASDVRLSRNMRKKLLNPNKLDNYLSSLTFIMTRSEHSDKLDNFLRTLNLEEVDIAADHFCLFNAIMRWLQEHPDIAPEVDREMTGRQLFTMLAPKGIQLERAFPDNVEMQRIASAFTETGANYRAWGTDSMVHYLIAPWLNIPVLVLATDAAREGGAVNGVLYDSGDIDPIYEDQIASFMTNDTMVLIHRQNHWQVALPSTGSRYNRESHTGNLHCTGYTEPSCQSFQSQ